mmetsp:Transcript_11555/g.12702  ORF Transcript_11555/g.12702 Transcript_11555/m.12702 type:complete len:209 (+) Transcript_11555:60-686(+)
MEDDEEEKLCVRLMLVGERNVGKTALVKKFSSGEFSPVPFVTPYDVYSEKRELNLPDKSKVHVQLLDTCKDVSTFASRNHKNVDCVILLYDITNIRSFIPIMRDIKEIKAATPTDTRFFLIGNKTDLEKFRKVSLTAAFRLSKEHHLKFLEISIKTGAGTERLFNWTAQIAMKIHRNRKSREENSIPTIKLAKKNKNSCKRLQRNSCS